MDQPGTNVPDHRGRTGLHLTGRDLDRNPDVRVTDVELLAAGWHVLRRTTLEYRAPDGTWETPTGCCWRPPPGCSTTTTRPRPSAARRWRRRA